MDPNHRDRIAFARICSGKLVRGIRLRQTRTGRAIALNTLLRIDRGNPAHEFPSQQKDHLIVRSGGK